MSLERDEVLLVVRQKTKHMSDFWILSLTSCLSSRNGALMVFIEFLSSKYPLSSSQFHQQQIGIPATILHRDQDQLVQGRPTPANVPLPIHVERRVQLAMINKMPVRLVILLPQGYTGPSCDYLSSAAALTSSPALLVQFACSRKYSFVSGRNLLAAEVNWV